MTLPLAARYSSEMAPLSFLPSSSIDLADLLSQPQQRLPPHGSDIQRSDQLWEPLSPSPDPCSSHFFFSTEDDKQPDAPPTPSALPSPAKQTARRRARNPFLGDDGLSEDECLLPPLSIDQDFQHSSLHQSFSQGDASIEVSSPLMVPYMSSSIIPTLCHVCIKAIVFSPITSDSTTCCVRSLRRNIGSI